MKRIGMLDKCVSEMIAAGEVVERPASVVKELVENSIDAGAKKITVEIKNGGISMIKISDNGSGIHKDDIKIAFFRHSTSKIQKISDLNSIETLGFRGEALCSISSVSRVELITAQEGQDFGVRYLIEGGQEKCFEDAGRSRGTTFVVRDLFFNTPARLKFLKKESTEASLVSSVVEKIALSHPEIAISFVKDGKILANTPGDGKVLSCVYSIYGRNIFEKMIEIEYKAKNVSVTGYITKPEAARPNRLLQNFFVNRRFAKVKIASLALEEAFKGFMMVGKHPACVIYIDIPYATVDVNVHPAKIEVRFENEKVIFEAVYNAVRNALKNDRSRKEISLSAGKYFHSEEDTRNEMKKTVDQNVKNCTKGSVETYNGREVKTKIFDSLCRPNESIFSARFSDFTNGEGFLEKTHKISVKKPDIFWSSEDLGNFNEEEHQKNTDQNSDIFQNEKFNSSEETSVLKNFNFKEHTLKNDEENEFKNIKVQSSEDDKSKKENFEDINLSEVIVKEKSKKVLGEIFECYIVVEEEDRIIFIDKHAAHERILYNKLKENEKEITSQVLLSAVVVSLDKESYYAAIENVDLFSKSGYQIEDFGNGSVIVRSAPTYLSEAEIESTVIEISGYIVNNKSDLSTKYLDWLYHNVACRSAMKAGEKSSEEEIKSLLDMLENSPEVVYCPHGRPVYIELKKKHIEKQFGRS